MSIPVNLSDYTRARTATRGSKPGLRAMLEVLDELRQLHTPTTVCRGCCSLQCRGTCDWADEYDGELLTVCSHCCIDSYVEKQNYSCLDDHNHGAEHGPGRAICATSGILETIMKAE